MNPRSQSTPALPRITWWISLSLMLLVLGSLCARMLHLPLSHDEHQFVAAGALVGDGMRPYRDFPLHHVPNLVFLYALVFAVSERMFLMARVVSLVAAASVAILVFFVLQRWARTVRPPIANLCGLVGVMALIGSPLTAHTSGRAWNHDLAVALALGCVMVLAGEQERRWSFAASGVLGGLAIGTRASFFPLGLVSTGWVVSRPTIRSSWLGATGAHIAGLGLGLVPTALSAIAAPSNFLFDNWTYTRLNTVYQTILGYQDAMTLKGKGAYALLMAADPVHITLILLAAAGIVATARTRRMDRDLIVSARLFLLAGLGVLVGSLIPTPSWPQYYFDPYPFFVIGSIGLGIASVSEHRSLAVPYGLAAIVLFAFGIRSMTESYGPIIDGSPTTHEQVERMAGEIAVHDRIRLVVTLAPIIPLEADLGILPQLAGGPFTWRVTPLYAGPGRTESHLINPQELAQMEFDPVSTAVLTGYESGNDGFQPNQKGGLEEPLVNLAMDLGLQPQRIDVEFAREITLWAPAALGD